MNNYKTLFYVFLLIVFTHAQRYGPVIVDNSCCEDNTIKASGQGKASALPDMARVQLSFNEKGTTSAEAVQSLAAKVNQAISILKANNYDQKSYETGSLNVYPQYNYLNGRSQVVGQQAQQSITVTVQNLDTEGKKIGVLVDALSQVNGININSVSFDIFNKTKLQAEARAAAFKDAKNKAEDYARFAGAYLGRVLKIDDSYTVSSPPIARNVAFASAKIESAPSTAVPLGNLDINYSTTITFALR